MYSSSYVKKRGGERAHNHHKKKKLIYILDTIIHRRGTRNRGERKGAPVKRFTEKLSPVSL